MSKPTCPAEIPDETPIQRLTEAYWWKTETLVDHAEGVAPITPDSHRDVSIAALAYSAKITARLDSERWPLVVEALSTGASTDQVADALALDVDNVVGGLLHWADKQRQAGRITIERHAEITRLVMPRRDGSWSL